MSAVRITVIALLQRLDKRWLTDEPTIAGVPLDERDNALVHSATEAERKAAWGKDRSK